MDVNDECSETTEPVVTNLDIKDPLDVKTACAALDNNKQMYHNFLSKFE